MRTVDADGDAAMEDIAHTPIMLQMMESTIVAVHKPVKVLLTLAAGIFSLRFTAAFLQIVLEVHAEHEHIAPGWLGEPSSSVPARIWGENEPMQPQMIHVWCAVICVIGQRLSTRQ